MNEKCLCQWGDARSELPPVSCFKPTWKALLPCSPPIYGAHHNVHFFQITRTHTLRLVMEIYWSIHREIKEDKNSYTGSLMEEQKLKNGSWSKAALEPGLSHHPLSCRHLLLPSLVLPKMVTQLLSHCIYNPPTATDYFFFLSSLALGLRGPHSFWASWLP